jgi:putative DNA-invertase from lambdoid prophage Rac
MLGMLQVFAQLERDLINERVNSGIRRYQNDFKAGRAVSKSGRNLPIGRPRSLFRVDEARRLRQEGFSWRQIAKQLGVPEATVRARCAEKLSCDCWRNGKQAKENSWLMQARRKDLSSAHRLLPVQAV